MRKRKGKVARRRESGWRSGGSEGWEGRLPDSVAAESWEMM